MKTSTPKSYFSNIKSLYILEGGGGEREGETITLDSQIYSPFSFKMIPEHCKGISVSQLV